MSDLAQFVVFLLVTILLVGGVLLVLFRFARHVFNLGRKTARFNPWNIRLTIVENPSSDSPVAVDREDSRSST
jgi:hypothetical protein